MIKFLTSADATTWDWYLEFQKVREDFKQSLEEYEVAVQEYEAAYKEYLDSLGSQSGTSVEIITQANNDRLLLMVSGLALTVVVLFLFYRISKNKKK